MVSRGIQRRANRSLRPMNQRLPSPLRLRQQMQHPSLIQSAVQFPFPQADARTWRVSTPCQQQPATQVPAPPAASQKAQPQEGSARRPRWRSLNSAVPQCVSEDELRWEFIQGKKRCSDWISSTAGQRVVAVYRPADCDGSAVFTPVRSSTYIRRRLGQLLWKLLRSRGALFVTMLTRGGAGAAPGP